MKEITRRLYTKPVMLGMAFFVGMALVVALFVTTKSTAAPNGFPVLLGPDEFETAADGETYHDFKGSNIPVNFFGQGSLKYDGLVALKGEPLGPGSDVDTVIERNQTVQSPGGSTTLTMTGLNLISINPIKVNYANGSHEFWDVRVNLSNYKASTGSMTIHLSTFDSTLKVWPRFTFTRVGGGVPPKVLDTGAPGGSGLARSTSRAPFDGTEIQPFPEPGPGPVPAPAPCAVVIGDFETLPKTGETVSLSAASRSSCPPVTLTSTNSPWGPCASGAFCIWVPITEEERWAKHKAGPRGFIKGGVGVAE